MSLIPLSRDDYVDHDWSLKVTSDINPSMKLMISSLIGKKYTMMENYTQNYIRTPEQVASIISLNRAEPVFGTGVYSLTNISHRNFAAKLTHTLNPETFYEISLEHIRREYFTRPTRDRDLTKAYEIAEGYFVDEAPFGYSPVNTTGIVGTLFGGYSCLRRDFSNVSATTLKMDITSQLNFNNLMKAGFEFVYNDLDLDFGTIKYLSDGNTYDERVQLHVFPIRAAAYIQDKLETKGFIMNLGMRLDYSDSKTDWWDVSRFDKDFFSSKYSEDKVFKMKESKAQWQLSPRLGISHPITQNSKLFFNYGHFKQMPAYDQLFQISRSAERQMKAFGDPNLVLAKTISYELGYDHTLFNDYVIQIAGFYRDIIDQQDSTRYTSIGGVVYDQTTSDSYEDIRGLELTFRKNYGHWWTAFINYTYQVNSYGHFGSYEIYEDPTLQKEYDEATVNLYQQKPIPRPYARANISFYTPGDYGPVLIGFHPLGAYTLNLLLNWRAGAWVDWNPNNIRAIQNNVQETDNFDSILRFSKTFTFNKFRILVFMDINNVFNYKRMSLLNWGEAGD